MILKQRIGEWIISDKVKEVAGGLTKSHHKVFVFRTDIPSIMVLPVDLLSCKGVEGATHPSVCWIGLEDRSAVHVHPLHDLECHCHPPRRSCPFQGGKHPHHYHQRCASSPSTMRSSQDHVLRVHPGQQTVFSAHHQYHASGPSPANNHHHHYGQDHVLHVHPGQQTVFSATFHLQRLIVDFWSRYVDVQSLKDSFP